MTNRDAINILEEVKILDDTMYAYNPSYLDALDMALTALEAEETWYATHEYPPKTRWIPVSERLPEEGCDVLITKEPFKIKGYKQEVIKAKRSVDPRSGKIKWWSEFGTLPNKAVLAWMPLPEPYREEGCE